MNIPMIKLTEIPKELRSKIRNRGIYFLNELKDKVELFGVYTDVKIEIWKWKMKKVKYNVIGSLFKKNIVF